MNVKGLIQVKGAQLPAREASDRPAVPRDAQVSAASSPEGVR